MPHDGQLHDRTEPVEAAVGVTDVTPRHVSGLIEVRSTEEALADRNVERDIKKPVVINHLAGYLRDVWAVCRDGRNLITTILEECRRQRAGEYDPDLLSKLKSQGGSVTYHNITNHKCVSAESWINEMASTDNPWSIDPTPIPEINPDLFEQIAVEVAGVADQYSDKGADLSDEDVILLGEETRLEYDKTIQEMTQKSADAMTRIMEDQLLEGGWKTAFRDFNRDFVTYPTAIMKFEVKNSVKTAFKENEDGSWILATESKLKETWRRVNPFNFYPAPNIATVDNGDICEKISFSRKDLTALIGVSGYRDDEIKAVLAEFGDGGLVDWEHRDFDKLIYESIHDETQRHGMSSLTIDAVEFHGSVQGTMLKAWGLSSIKDELAEYDIWAILIGNHVIMAQLNPHPMGNKPYQTCSYERDPDSIWGRSIPQKVRPSQLDANQAKRALMNNISLASGPQVLVNQSLLSPNEDITAIFPYKIWKMRRSKSSEAVDVGSVFRFFQPASHVEELMATIQFFANEADEDSGIPKVAEGSLSNTSNNAASTASGLSMILDNASRALRNVIGNIDEYVIQRQIDNLYMLNMLDPNIPNEAKGDLVVRARGILSTGLRDKLQELRRNFMLMVLENEALTNILGIEGITSLLREIAKPLEMPLGFISSNDKLERDQREAEEDAQRSQALVNDILQRAIAKGLMEESDAQAILEEQQAEIEQQQA